MFNEIGYSALICCLVYFIIFEGKPFHNFVLNIILALGLTNYDYIRMSIYNYVQVYIARIHPDQTIKTIIIINYITVVLVKLRGNTT